MQRRLPLRKSQSIADRPSLYEPLERRLLLVAGYLDGNFGGGDGYVLIEPFTAPIDTRSSFDGGVQGRWPYRFQPQAMVEGIDGKIYFGGTATGGDSTNPDYLFPSLVRLQEDGELDSSWGGSGARTDLPFRFVRDMQVLPNGDLLIAGDSGERPNFPAPQPAGSGVFLLSTGGTVTRLGPPGGGVSALPYAIHRFDSGADAGRMLILSAYNGTIGDTEATIVDTELALWLAEPDGTIVPGALADLQSLMGSAYDTSLTQSAPTLTFAVGDGGEIYVRVRTLFPHPGSDSFAGKHAHVRLDLRREGEARSLEPRTDWGDIFATGQQISIFAHVSPTTFSHPPNWRTGDPEAELRFLSSDNGKFAVDPEGRLLLAGQVSIGTLPPPLHGPGIIRVNHDGSVDQSWGDRGLVTFLGQGNDAGILSVNPADPFDLYSLPDGKLLGVERAGGQDGLDALHFLTGVFRLMPDGTPDETFATGSPHGPGRNLIRINHPSPLDPLDAQPRLTTSTLTADGDLLIAAHLERHGGPWFDLDSILGYFVGRVDLTGDAPLPTDEDEDDGGGGGGDVPAQWDNVVFARLVERDELRVVEVIGTSSPNRIVLRTEEGAVRVMVGAAGQEVSIAITSLGQPVASLALDDVDRIEVFGFAGGDDLSSQITQDSGGFVTLLGGFGNDTLAGGGRYDRLLGEDGNDSLSGGDGDQLLMGGPGNDTLTGSGGRDALWGEAGDDRLVAGLDGDYLDGGSGADTLFGESGDDTLIAGAGNDLLNGGDGSNDLIWPRDASSAGAQIDLLAGTAVFADSTDSVLLIEHVLGSDADDELRGDNGRNFLLGGGGDDRLFGSDGKDTLLGGAGSDLLDGGDDWDLLLDLDVPPGGVDADTLIGGGGFDIGLMDREADEDQEVERVVGSIDELLNLL